MVDEDLYGDPNIDLEAEYLGNVICSYARRTLHSYFSRTNSSEDESPYPEVRSAVANTDDPTMPAGTLRAWILGLVWAIVIPGVNQFYFFRYPSVTIGPVRHYPPLYLLHLLSHCTITFSLSRNWSHFPWVA